jgi:hypothetical protein
MPIRRARARVASGSLFDRIEMKIRLSMPSTTSSMIRVASAAQASGVAKMANASNMTLSRFAWRRPIPCMKRRARANGDGQETIHSQKRSRDWIFSSM